MNDNVYYELDTDIKKYFLEIEKDFGFAVNLKYIFQANSKQKTMIKLVKLPEHYQQLLNADILVSINENFYNTFEEDTREILMMQEIDKIEINLEKSTIKIGQPSLKTSLGIVKRFSFEKVEKALEVERLYEEQLKDKNKGKK
jgi:hypothetical protein